MKRMIFVLTAALACLMPAAAFADAAVPDAWERASGGDPVIWVFIIAVIVIVAAILFFVLRKRKKK